MTYGGVTSESAESIDREDTIRMTEASAQNSETGAPGLGLPRRMVTAPISMPRPSHAITDAFVETLYNHSNAKIVSFTTSYKSIVKGNTNARTKEEESLPWSSPAERTIAVGPFRIYRARGSVAFLSCGSALQPILPKSQCWCIDEINSKYVLQIRKPNFWRIELPVSTGQDKALAESFKGVLNEILQFEKTECPFQRSFTIPLPNRPTTPPKKKAWTPRQWSSEAPVDLTASLDTQPVRPIPIWNDKKLASDITPCPSLPQDPMGPAVETDNGPATLASKSGATNINVASAVEVIDASIAAREAEFLVPPKIEKHEKEHRFIDGPSPTASDLPPVFEDGAEVEADTGNLPAPSQDAPTRSTMQVNRSVSASAVSTIHASEYDEMMDDSQTGFEDDYALRQSLEGAGSQGSLRKAKLRRTAGFSMRRSATSPSEVGWKTTNNSAPSLPLQARKPLHRRPPISEFEPRSLSHSPPPVTAAKPFNSKAGERPASSRVSETETLRDHSSVRSEDSFHSMDSWRFEPARQTPSPPRRSESPGMGFASSDDTISLPKKRTGSKSPSRLALPGSWDTETFEGNYECHESVAAAPETLQTATKTIPAIHITQDDGAGSSSLKVPQQTLRHRASADSISLRRRAMPPLPTAAPLRLGSTGDFSAYRSRLGTVSRIPLTIIAKTAEILLGPPSHLLVLMLKVAAKIISGEWRGRVYGYNESGEQIPVQWDYSEGDFSDWSDDEDVDVGSVLERRASFRTDGGEVE